MMIGFSGYLIFGVIIGCSYHKITKIILLFVVFYGLMQGFGNFGPGNMLALLSSEAYTTGVPLYSYWQGRCSDRNVSLSADFKSWKEVDVYHFCNLCSRGDPGELLLCSESHW